VNTALPTVKSLDPLGYLDRDRGPIVTIEVQSRYKGLPIFLVEVHASEAFGVRTIVDIYTGGLLRGHIRKGTDGSYFWEPER
jgi:hypothetical protein